MLQVEVLNVFPRYLNDIRGAIVESFFFDSNDLFICVLVSYMKTNCCFLICHDLSQDDVSFGYIKSDYGLLFLCDLA